jgi:hypothetical protein
MTVRYDEMSIAALAASKLPRSKNNVISLIAWACGENNSTDLSTKAKWNPWDTEEPGEPGETDFNKAGVKDYPSMVEGLQAFLRTLHNGHYAPIIKCLEESADPQTTLTAIANSPWGYKGDLTILPVILADLGHYAGLIVGGSEGTTVEITDGITSDKPVTAAEEASNAPVAETPVIETPAPAPAPAPLPAEEVKANADVKEGDNILSALQAQLGTFIQTHQSANSALAARIRTHISELEAIATALESLV